MNIYGFFSLTVFYFIFIPHIVSISSWSSLLHVYFLFFSPHSFQSSVWSLSVLTLQTATSVSPPFHHLDTLNLSLHFYNFSAWKIRDSLWWWLKKKKKKPGRMLQATSQHFFYSFLRVSINLSLIKKDRFP